jgi:hypothetical protein
MKLRSLVYQPVGGHPPVQPVRNSDPDDAYFVPPAGQLDNPVPNLGVELYPFTGYTTNPARNNGDDYNPYNVQTMRVAYDDGVMLYNGVDGITEKRFGPSQFYVLSDSIPAETQTAMLPHGHVKSQILTSSDIQTGPASNAALQVAAPGKAGGPVLYGGFLRNPGGA